jgi:hypothetical protein
MSNQPSVFISSTIKEFRDLRSAIAFTLNEQGFIVYQSEASDFDIKGDRTAIDECFENINNCDYYILLIGNKRGNLFEDGVSITRQEYRVARRAFMASGRPRLFFYLRRDTERSLQSSRTEQLASGIDDPEHLKLFIEEIKQPGIEGAPNFLTLFDDFKELMQTLVIRMNLGRNLSEKLVRYSLLSELLSNLTHVVTRSGISVFLPHHFMSKVRERLNISANDIYGQITVEDDLMLDLGMALIGRTRGEELSTKIIEVALNQGIFLTFDHVSGSLQESKLHIALKQIFRDIQSLRYLDRPEAPKGWDINIVSAISAKRKGGLHLVILSGIDLAYALAYYDRMEDIFYSHLAFCRVLLGLDEDIQPYRRQPLTIFRDIEEHRLRKEKVSEAEISHLIQSSIWPLGTKVPRDIYGATDEEQVKNITEQMLAILNKAGINGNRFKEAMERAAKDYLDKDTASPTEGIENLDTI